MDSLVIRNGWADLMDNRTCSSWHHGSADGQQVMHRKLMPHSLLGPAPAISLLPD